MDAATKIFGLTVLVLAGCGEAAGGSRSSSSAAPPSISADAAPDQDRAPDAASDQDRTADAAPDPDRAPGASPADAGPAHDATAPASEASDGGVWGDGGAIDPMTLDGAVSTSIGGPSDGRLEGGVPFPVKARGIIRNPRRLNAGGHYGTVETVQALIRAAAVVDEVMPGGYPAMVNDLSFAQGGPIPHHGSHQAGRDVDVLFYLLDREGNPRPAKGVPLDRRGRGWDFGDLADPADDQFVKLDAPRTWRFLQALIEDDETELQRIFVAEHLREILLREARRQKAPRAALRRVGELTCQPGSPHDDHFHFRFFCNAGDIAAGCEDSPPIYPWRRQQLAKLGLRPKRYVPRARRRRATTTSRAEARAKAGRMHWRVVAFLRERETWSERPHPGRPYCR